MNTDIKDKTILAIETSCDETAAAVIKGTGSSVFVASSIVSSQIDIHKKYGGVVPEIAAREHVYNILPVINEALKVAMVTKNDLSAIAVTQGPGLITSLHIGTETAKALATSWSIPLIPIHHIEAHLYANFINNSTISFPATVLTVSGGHTALYLMKGHGELSLIGKTIDDAAGEAFDKGAQLLGLGYPGGPQISKEAKRWDLQTKSNYLEITLPRPMLNKPNYNFSFSGLKTALLYQIQKDPNWKLRIPEYAYKYQEAIVDTLIKKTIKAAKHFSTETILLAGGVSANEFLRQSLIEACNNELHNTKIHIPNFEYTTDNAAMVGACAYFKPEVKYQIIKAEPNLEL